MKSFINNYLNRQIQLQEIILNYLDDSNDQDNLLKFSSYYENEKIREDKEELQKCIEMIASISKNHHRSPNFYHKIEQIIDKFKLDISENFSNMEIFNIFKNNIRILHFLVKEKIIVVDKKIQKNIKSKYSDYFYPKEEEDSDEQNDSDDYIDDDDFEMFYLDRPKYFDYLETVDQKIEEEEESQERKEEKENQKKEEEEEKQKRKNDYLKMHEQKKETGENENMICQLIRNDDVNEFISYVNLKNIKINQKIESSDFETNSFLRKNRPTIIEYAAFFGSIQIFKYLIINKCKKLKKINIPSSVKWIGKYCFSRCESLIEVTLSSSLEKIGKFSFFQCTSLPEILIPSSVTEIGEGSFHECSSLKKVSILSHISIIEEKTFFGCSLLEKILISSSVKEIGQNSFGECTSLTEINIPPSVTIIRMNAFINCSSLILVSINSNLTVIEKSAFEMCASLREITIPPSVTQISERCFYGCKKLEKITMDPFKTKVCDDSFKNCQSFCHLIINSNARIINQINSVVIKLAKRITIPDSVVKIESKSFSNCANLEYILFSKDSSLKIIEDYAFSNCYLLIKFKFPSSVSFIGNYAFNSCSSLTEIKIPSFVTSIQDYTFCNCKQLNSVSIYFPMSSIGKHAFDGCSALNNIKLPNSLTLIDESAFENCNSLAAITIPVSVKNIKSSAFCKCLALTKAIIPSSVSSIGENCFKDCKKLLNIEIDIYHTKIEKNSFENETKIILKDGIFNYLRSVSNIDNEISITSTTVGGGNPKTLIEYHDDLSKLFYTDNVKDAWICFKFENYCIIPTSYTIRSYCNKKDWMHPRNWTLEGITIDNEIITLDTRKNCPFLNGPNLVHNFVIDRKVCTPFKCLKISNTGLNWSENYFFSFDTIEFFGRLV